MITAMFFDNTFVFFGLILQNFAIFFAQVNWTGAWKGFILGVFQEIFDLLVVVNSSHKVVTLLCFCNDRVVAIFSEEKLFVFLYETLGINVHRLQ